jgi:glycosyltransferase involved in cell wall biosynthesis
MVETINQKSQIEKYSNGKMFCFYDEAEFGNQAVVFIRKVKEFSPDLIHLHNLHGSYINLPQLFVYIKKNNIPVVWTLHDCWPFTAICSHFMIAGCEKWKDGCNHCSQRKRFSSSPVDMTEYVWNAKRKWFTQVPELTIVTPSHWLGDLVKKSFLKEYNSETIYNGVDLNTFKETSSDFRNRYGLEGKKVVLGVAFDWSYAKGLDVFIELSRRLGDEFKVVLVGTNDEIDKSLPENIVSVHRTANRQELAGIYSSANVFEINILNIWFCEK